MNYDQILTDARATLMCHSTVHVGTERGDLSTALERHDWWLYWGDKSIHLGHMSQDEAKKLAAEKISA
jgi:hypothetical protein